MHEPDDERYCVAADRCRGYDPIEKSPATTSARDPFCRWCQAAYERDIRLLRYDWLDLAEMQSPTLSQAWDKQRAGSAGPPMPLKGDPEALQAEIVHVLLTWEHLLRVRQRLSKLGVGALVGAWHTTRSNPPPPPKVRPWLAVQRAIGVIVPRVQVLALAPALPVRLTGAEDPVTPVTGLEAVDQLVELHVRARAMLGMTRRKFWVPGECWQEECAAEHRKAVAGGTDAKEWLYRSEPLRERDEPWVYCAYCNEPRTYEEYVRYVEMLVWPTPYRGGEEAA